MKPAKTRHIRHVPYSWADIPWGDYYRDALTRHLQPCLDRLYGFHLLKIGSLSAEIDTASCAISHQVNVGLQGDNLQVLADAGQTGARPAPTRAVEQSDVYPDQADGLAQPVKLRGGAALALSGAAVESSGR